MQSLAHVLQSRHPVYPRGFIIFPTDGGLSSRLNRGPVPEPAWLLGCALPQWSSVQARRALLTEVMGRVAPASSLLPGQSFQLVGQRLSFPICEENVELGVWKSKCKCMAFWP